MWGQQFANSAPRGVEADEESRLGLDLSHEVLKVHVKEASDFKFEGATNG
jgi:hypothetical protein|tara:strand:- start:147 stop:296 length:150 start_codon:yes stop_codon:yes gene_type:complete